MCNTLSALLLDTFTLVSEMAELVGLDCRMSVFSFDLCYSYFVPTANCRFTLSLDANTIGSVAGIASIDWGCSVQIMAAATIGSKDQSFNPSSGATLCVYTSASLSEVRSTKNAECFARSGFVVAYSSQLSFRMPFSVVWEHRFWRDYRLYTLF